MQFSELQSQFLRQGGNKPEHLENVALLRLVHTTPGNNE
eukprot:CAMPEP_0184748522 /NCGR_PEP_ID=MMETSP0315-20130426/20048_1 /TAXON_ID=101924 /ORGANISM="Rhodosorus marinus, Strain UTEX LB 2760" /LENGTH=38 /DNA_ID= /DNA_START= /DNA_END= /DNA_ORIENTATION=